MAIKIILVHVSSDEQHTARLQFAIGLAKRHDAQLEIICNTTPVDMPETAVGRSASLGYLAEVREQAEQRAAQIKQEVEELCGQEIAYRWAVTSGDHAVELAKSALYADLTVITQAHPKFLEDRVIPEHLPDRLPLLSARPTLILPWGNPGRPDPKRVMVAWSPCREAARAVGDALPFLEQAEQVIVTVFAADRKTGAAEGDASGIGRLREFLGGHGIKFEQVVRPKSGAHAGKRILEAVSEFKCELLVMGSYGHTRWREVVFGGSTRTILGGTITPVLMSH